MSKLSGREKMTLMMNRELDLLRSISTPNRSLKNLRTILREYGERIGQLSDVNASRCLTILDELNCTDRFFTEDLRRDIFAYCEKNSKIDPVAVAYAQVAISNLAAHYLMKADSLEISSENFQWKFLKSYYLANWYTNILLELFIRHQDRLGLFSMFGEAGNEGKK